MRSFPLSSLKTGITRLRDKGGASPDSLFDLLNGYVNASGIPTSRDGTRLNHTLPAGTKGLFAFKGKRHVFALSAIDPGDSGYVVDILIHPDPTFAGTIVAIHFAKPFLGFPYVAAEFSDGNTYHYWLQSTGVWKANTVYQLGDLVQPSVPDGFAYKASVANSPTAWAPNVIRAVGDTVQPTEANGYYYVVTEVDGDSPASGAIEPVWTAQDGAEVIEDVDTSNLPSDTTTTTTTKSPAGKRYDNFPGSIDV